MLTFPKRYTKYEREFMLGLFFIVKMLLGNKSCNWQQLGKTDRQQTTCFKLTRDRMLKRIDAWFKDNNLDLEWNILGRILQCILRITMKTETENMKLRRCVRHC